MQLDELRGCHVLNSSIGMYVILVRMDTLKQVTNSTSGILSLPC